LDQETRGAWLRKPFHPDIFAQTKAKLKPQQVTRLQNLAANLNYQLVPNP
jgi:hypothetical protein